MYKAAKDFTYAGFSFKKGEVIPPYTFEADDLYILLVQGWVVKDNPKKEDVK